MLNQPAPHVEGEYIDKICRVGQGHLCCRYLVGDQNGLSCAKVNRGLKKIIDAKWQRETHAAQGDNCEGQPDLKTAVMPKTDKDAD